MSEPAVETETAGVGLDDLATGLAEAVRAVPGVARLEPSLKNFLGRLKSQGATTIGRPEPPLEPTESHSARRTRSSMPSSTSRRADHRAVVVADAVQRRVHDLLVTQGRQVGSVSINVLTVEPA